MAQAVQERGRKLGLCKILQVVCTVVSSEKDVDPDIAAMIGTSAALATSGIPFEGPIGAARVGYTEDEVASSDFIHCPLSSIYDAGSSIELNSTFFKLVSWYDNEWGYSNRVIDLLDDIVKKGI